MIGGFSKIVIFAIYFIKSCLITMTRNALHKTNAFSHCETTFARFTQSVTEKLVNDITMLHRIFSIYDVQVCNGVFTPSTMYI